MDFKPKVSIVIPVYNGSDYLREAIDSALAQTYPDIEVLVVNDGSTDEGKTEEIAKSYGRKIRYFHKENGGVATALNLGIREMKGDYFSWLSHDDVYYPFKVERQVRCLEPDKEDVILYSDFDFIDHRSKFLCAHKIKPIAPADFRQALILGSPIHGCTVLIPKFCFAAVGLFDETLKTTQDYALWFKLGARYQFVHIPEVLIKSRLHANQGSITMGPVHLDESNNYFIKCLNEILESGDLGRESLNRFLFQCALNLKSRGYVKASRYALDLFLQGAKAGGLYAPLTPLFSGYYRIYNKKLGLEYWQDFIRRIARKAGLSVK